MTLRSVDKSSPPARRRLMFARYGDPEGGDEIGFAPRLDDDDDDDKLDFPRQTKQMHRR